MNRLKTINQLFDAEFDFFDCYTSHRIVVLRSSYMSNGKNWNLDLKFEGVTYVELPTSLKGIHIFNGENEDKAYIGTRYEGEDYGNSPNKYMQLYVIVSPGKRFYVMANCVSIETNDLPNDVSSIIKPFARPSL